MHQVKVAISVQQDQDHGLQDGGHHGAQDDVTLELFVGEERFCKDSLY